MFWDRKLEKATVVKAQAILKDQATMSLVALPDGKLMGGTTVSGGSGSKVKAKEAQVYIMDVASKKVLGHTPLIPGARSYRDMILADNGMVYGYTDKKSQVFFVFDPAARRIVHVAKTADQFGPTNNQQGPRIFVKGSDGTVYVFFEKGIAKVDPHSYKIEMLAKSPVKIGPGGAYADGRIFFGTYHGPLTGHLFSWKVPTH